MEIIVKYSGDFEQFISGLEDIGVFRPVDLGQGFAVLDISADMISVLEALPLVEDIELPKSVFLNNSFTPPVSCPGLPDFRRSLYSGAGVLVGIIDTGVDYTNREFLLPDGRTRIAAIWDQSAQGTPPPGFFEGAEYSREKIDSALLSADPFSVIPRTDISGHGTAVAGIAAGNTTGAAYASELIVVRVRSASGEDEKTTQLMKALRYVITKAAQLQKPAAINISYGMNQGSHRGDSLFESYISAVSREWKTTIVIPTGNEGGAGHHYEGRLSNGEELDIGFFTAKGIDSFYLSMWKNYTDIISAELFLPDGKSTGVINRYTTNTNAVADGLSVTSVFGQPSARSVFQEIFYDIRPAGGTIPQALWTLRLRAESIVDGHFDIWLPTIEQVTADTYFTDPGDTLTMTIPSTAAGIIRVAGFDSRTGAAAAFSGRGTRCPGEVLPDVSAPAVNVAAPSLSGGFDSLSGTSFASPAVTGYAAQLMQWGIVCGNSKFMYGERVKAELRLAAQRSRDINYPDPSLGYGRIF